MKHYIYNTCKYITFVKEIKTISGIDMLSSVVFKNRTGYTGTPDNIVPWYDPDGKLVIEAVSQMAKIKIDMAFASHVLLHVENIISYKTVLDLLVRLLIKYSKTNTLIDISGILIGITWRELSKIVQELKWHQYKYIVYWDINHVGIKYDIHEDTSDVWNEQSGHDIFYFYDQQHITGIDAKEPLTSTGLVLVGSGCTYRNFVQGFFRLRQLGVGQTINVATIDFRCYDNQQLKKILVANKGIKHQSDAIIMARHELFMLCRYKDNNIKTFQSFTQFEYPTGILELVS